MMVKSKIQLNKQISFCEELLNKLKIDLKENLSEFHSNDIYYSIHNHSRMENDIVRLRRELNILSNMLKR